MSFCPFIKDECRDDCRFYVDGYENTTCKIDIACDTTIDTDRRPHDSTRALAEAFAMRSYHMMQTPTGMKHAPRADGSAATSPEYSLRLEYFDIPNDIAAKLESLGIGTIREITWKNKAAALCERLSEYETEYLVNMLEEHGFEAPDELKERIGREVDIPSENREEIERILRMSVEGMPISTRAKTLCHKVGIHNLKQLFSAKALSDIEGMGNKTLRELHKVCYRNYPVLKKLGYRPFNFENDSYNDALIELLNTPIEESNLPEHIIEAYAHFYHARTLGEFYAAPGWYPRTRGNAITLISSEKEKLQAEFEKAGYPTYIDMLDSPIIAENEVDNDPCFFPFELKMVYTSHLYSPRILLRMGKDGVISILERTLNEEFGVKEEAPAWSKNQVISDNLDCIMKKLDELLRKRNLVW